MINEYETIQLEVRMVRLIVPTLLVVSACGNVARNRDAATVPYDAAIDTPAKIDAPPDSAPLPPPPEAREFVSGGTRMTGATYTFDVQVGHGVQQGKITGPTYKLEGNAAVKP